MVADSKIITLYIKHNQEVIYASVTLDVIDELFQTSINDQVLAVMRYMTYAKVA